MGNASILRTRYDNDFIPSRGTTCFSDEWDIKNWLEAIDEKVLEHGDTGRYGYCITASGYKVHTNGFCYRIGSKLTVGGK